MKRKHLISCLMAAAMAASTILGVGGTAVNAAPSDFMQELQQEYGKPDQTNNTEVRWWLACGSHTDETINEEIQTLYDQGFTGFELCLLDENGVDNNIYGYGSEEWSHDVKTAITKATDLGMSVGLTSGTHWHDANIPGLDPNSDAAGQEAGWSMERLEAGQARSGKLTLPPNNNASKQGYTDETITRTLIGVYAYKVKDAGASVKIEEDETVKTPMMPGYHNPTQAKPMVLDQTKCIDLTSQVKDNSLTWTAPADGEYVLVGLWKQGTFQKESRRSRK